METAFFLSATNYFLPHSLSDSRSPLPTFVSQHPNFFLYSSPSPSFFFLSPTPSPNFFVFILFLILSPFASLIFISGSLNISFFTFSSLFSSQNRSYDGLTLGLFMVWVISEQSGLKVSFWVLYYGVADSLGLSDSIFFCIQVINIIVQDLPVSMSTQGALMSLPSSSSTHQWIYDIFLSFRGEDTSKNFIDQLYDALKRKGICTFRDDEKLERGSSISKELLKAIEKSRFAIVIFSENYVFSKWCLDELIHIVRCMKETGLKVVPVFYHVNPSDIRRHRGTFAQAFKKHKKCFRKSILERLEKYTSKKMKKWRSALREVASISGWNLQDRHEAKFIQKIVRDMMEKLSPKISSITKNLVGIESTVQKLISSYLNFENNVGMIGIYGMGGLGKTTLARFVYDEYRSHFEGSSFIANVRENSKKHGLPKLQQQLLADILEDINICIRNVHDGVDEIKMRLCHKKVLLVLDDVDHLDQLEKLAGEHGWFGLGSWIIVTTRDVHVLIQHGVFQRYNPNGLDFDDALKLFCLKAFKNEQPEKGYMQLSRKVVEYANGLPLAIVTLGSFLVGRTIDEWKSALHSLKKTKGETFHILKISYDGLEEMWKEIFLDIACFFRQWKKNKVIDILETCGFNARIGISVLVEKTLLSIDDNGHLGMHDLLQEMGEKIVRFESGGKLGKQSRLWLFEDLLHVLENDMATEAIQAIVVEHWNENFNLDEFYSEGFSKMSKLRMLINKMDFLRTEMLEYYWNAPKYVPNDQRQLFFPRQLRHLSWNFCPLKCLSSSFQRMELVQLDLQYSRIEYLWEGLMLSANLKFIDLSHSENLIISPDFSGVPMLEKLNLSCCYQLVEIHPSIGQLSKLRYLHLEECESLTYLPTMSTVMQSLTVLNLSHCIRLSLFPKFTGIMESLSELYLGYTDIKNVACSTIKCLTSLTLLDLSCCSYLKCLPSNMDNLRSLETLDLSWCYQLVEIHPSIVQLSSLRYLLLEGCESLTDLPTMFAEMQSLTVLNLSHCIRLSSFPKSTLLDLSYCGYLECLSSNMDNLRSLETLNLSSCCQLVEIHPSIVQLNSLRYLLLEGCESLTDLPTISAEMQSLTVLNLSDCIRLSSFPKFTGIMKSLSELYLGDTDIKKVACSTIKCLTSLTLLDLSYCRYLECLPSNMDNLRSLETLNLSWCRQLVEIHPSIVQLSSLRYLLLEGCESLTDLPTMSAEMQSLTVLNLSHCIRLSSFPKFTGIMKSLSELYLGYTDIKKVAPSSIECLTTLTLLDLSECKKLKCLPSNMDNLRSLKTLNLCRCSELKSLPRLPSTLRYINAQHCSSLKWSLAEVKLSGRSQPLSQLHPYDESNSRVELTILSRSQPLLS